MNALAYIDPSGHFFLMKFCVARTFWVERHLDVVQKLVEIYHRMIYGKNYDDCFINEVGIKLFKLWKRKIKNFKKF